MQETVYRVVGVLCAVVGGTPIGTNLGLVHVLWMLVSGQLLNSRGAVIPGLSATGLSEPAVRRAWAALGQGGWRSADLLGRWGRHVEQAGAWQAVTDAEIELDGALGHMFRILTGQLSWSVRPSRAS